MEPFNILVVDDHPVINAGLVKLLAGHQNIRHVNTCTTSAEALQRARALAHDVALIDISLRDGNGVTLCRLLKQENPLLKVLMFSMHTEKAFILQSLGAGANGYIVKTVAPDKLLTLIFSAMQGNVVFCDQAQLVMGTPDVDLKPAGFNLTKREKEILKLICQGCTNADIAGMLFLSILTVETHRKNIMHKLHTKNAAELTRRAMELHLI